MHKGSWIWAAIVLALSVSVKLIPLIFLPILFQWFTKHKASELSKKTFPTIWKGTLKLVAFYAIVIGTIVMLFLPFISQQFIENYQATVGLWFQKFEFNASIYYIARELGTLFRGYNEIAIIGKIIPVIVVFVLLIITFFRKNKSPQQLITGLLMGVSFYYFTTTIIICNKVA